MHWLEEKWERGLQEGLQEGLQRGIQQGYENAMTHVAVSLLERNESIEKVVTITGLTEAKIRILANKMSKK